MRVPNKVVVNNSFVASSPNSSAPPPTGGSGIGSVPDFTFLKSDTWVMLLLLALSGGAINSTSFINRVTGSRLKLEYLVINIPSVSSQVEVIVNGVVIDQFSFDGLARVSSVYQMDWAMGSTAEIEIRMVALDGVNSSAVFECVMIGDANLISGPTSTITRLTSLPAYYPEGLSEILGVSSP